MVSILGAWAQAIREARLQGDSEANGWTSLDGGGKGGGNGR